MWCLLATTFKRWKKLAPVGHNQDFLGVQNRLSEGDSVWGYSNFLCTTSDQQWQTSGMKTWESGVQHRYMKELLNVYSIIDFFCFDVKFSKFENSTNPADQSKCSINWLINLGFSADKLVWHCLHLSIASTLPTFYESSSNPSLLYQELI